MASNVGFESNMLRKVKGGKNCIEGNGLGVKFLVNVYIEVTSDKYI